MIGCLNEKKVVCDKYDEAEIEGTISMLQYVCNDKSMDSKHSINFIQFFSELNRLSVDSFPIRSGFKRVLSQ